MSLICPVPVIDVGSPQFKSGSTLETHFRCAPSRYKQSRHLPHAHCQSTSVCWCGDCNGLVHDGLRDHTRTIHSSLDGLGIAGAVILLLVLVMGTLSFLRHKWRSVTETVTVHKQRLRTQDFLRSSALGASLEKSMDKPVCESP